MDQVDLQESHGRISSDLKVGVDVTVAQPLEG